MGGMKTEGSQSRAPIPATISEFQVGPVTVPAVYVRLIGLVLTFVVLALVLNLAL
jgi:hypothetical protein